MKLLGKIRYLGHSGFEIISDEECKILIDPYLNTEELPGLKILEKNNIDRNSLTNVDLIIVTHDHFDHFDKKAIIELFEKNKGAIIVAHDHILSQVDLPDRNKRSINIGNKINVRGIEIEAVNAHHPRSFCPLAFVINVDGKRIYHAGDTELTTSFTNVKPDIALVPIGGTLTMDCTDAVRATKIMKPEIVIPMHYNTFENIVQNPNEFKEKIENSILKTEVVILKQDESFDYWLTWFLLTLNLLLLLFF